MPATFRRSELVALDCEDIEECETGFTIRHGKTDQEGAGAAIAIVRGSIACPVAALRAWLDAGEITTGPLFRSIRKGGKVAERLSAQSVADIVKTHAERVGLDPALFAGHSLRAGFLTSAAKRGASVFKMMDVIGAKQPVSRKLSLPNGSASRRPTSRNTKAGIGASTCWNFWTLPRRSDLIRAG